MGAPDGVVPYERPGSAGMNPPAPGARPSTATRQPALIASAPDRDIPASALEYGGQDQVVFTTPQEWLVGLRLQKFAESMESIGCLAMTDYKEVLEEDLIEMGMPPLPRRRFLQATYELDAPAAVKRMHRPRSELMSKVDKLNAAGDSAFDDEALSDATDEVVQAASAMKLGALDPTHWLDDHRLSMFKANFDGLRSVTEWSMGTYWDTDLQCTDFDVLRVSFEENVKGFTILHKSMTLEPIFWTWKIPFAPKFRFAWSLKFFSGLTDHGETNANGSCVVGQWAQLDGMNQQNILAR